MAEHTGIALSLQPKYKRAAHKRSLLTAIGLEGHAPSARPHRGPSIRTALRAPCARRGRRRAQRTAEGPFAGPARAGPGPGPASGHRMGSGLKCSGLKFSRYKCSGYKCSG